MSSSYILLESIPDQIQSGFFFNYSISPRKVISPIVTNEVARLHKHHPKTNQQIESLLPYLPQDSKELCPYFKSSLSYFLPSFPPFISYMPSFFIKCEVIFIIISIPQLMQNCKLAALFCPKHGKIIVWPIIPRIF